MDGVIHKGSSSISALGGSGAVFPKEVQSPEKKFVSQIHSLCHITN